MTERTTRTTFAGTMFLVAMVASLAGGTLIGSVLVDPGAVTDPGTDWGVVVLGVGLEIVNAVAVVGIVAALWPMLASRHPATTAGYLGIRVAEALVCALAALIPLAQRLLLTRVDASAAEAAALPLGVFRDALLSYGVPIFFGLGAVLFYLMLMRSSLLPRYIIVWGLVGAVGILANIFITDLTIKPFVVLPMIANEIYLGVYLIAKGMRSTQSSGMSRLPSDTAGSRMNPSSA